MLKYSFDEYEYFENSINILKIDTLASLNELRKTQERKMYASFVSL